MFEVDGEQIAQVQRSWLPVDQRDRVDREGVLHLRYLVKLFQQRLGIESVLHFDHQASAIRTIRQVLDIRDALDAASVDAGLDLLDYPLGSHQIRQLGDHDPLAPRMDLLYPRCGPDPERPSTGGVSVANAVQPDDLA